VVSLAGQVSLAGHTPRSRQRDQQAAMSWKQTGQVLYRLRSRQRDQQAAIAGHHWSLVVVAQKSL
jgi:hypothetical protein